MHNSSFIQDTMTYINQNLTEYLSLESLAIRTHFSPYHFHRLFCISTGEAPMEYIRKLRLRAASHELLSVELNISDIASKYRFESQDGFSRAFKRYYGTTPGEYRNLNALSTCSEITKKIEEESTIMDDMRIYEMMVCSTDEKRELLNTLDRILSLSQKAHISGLLSLESEIDTIGSAFFAKAIQMLIDGIESKNLREILLNYALCGGNLGKELLGRVIITEGILAIQQGMNTMLLREKLSSYFGDDFIEEIDKHFGVDPQTQQKKLHAFIQKNQEKPFLCKETSSLEEPLGRLDNRSLQRLLREIDIVILHAGIIGSSGKIQIKVLQNVSRKLAAFLMNELTAIKVPTTTEIAKSQKCILETMNSLINHGDIII